MTNFDDILEPVEKGGKPKNFFIFAGAGSGKTYTLVELLNLLRDKKRDDYRRTMRNIAVITYTNAATDEIKRRLKFDDLFKISTIHSFVWDVIRPYQIDIKQHYKSLKLAEIRDLEEKQSKAKNRNSDAYKKRKEKINKVNVILSDLDNIEKFAYNPNGDNFSKTSLDHEDVIKISSVMLKENKLLQKIVSQQYPYIFIDESQDTKKDIVDALLELALNTDITLGFIGDVKQKIYSDGKENFQKIIPNDWNRPELNHNYRSKTRIVELGNKIGIMIDEKGMQIPVNKEKGFVHLFLVDASSDANKDQIEKKIADKMSDIAQDTKWSDLTNDICLVLEHEMAARRMGFSDFYNVMHKVSKYSQSLLQGTVADMSLFTNLILPLYNAILNKDNGLEMKIIRSYSPLINMNANDDPYENIKLCADATKQLINKIDKDLSIRNIIKFIHEKKLFPINDILLQTYDKTRTDIEDDTDETTNAWINVMDCPFSQVLNYYKYINGESRFATHQGVKGLEYDRVMVLIDDEESKGFMFSYNKVFGVKPKSNTDIENEKEGKDTSILRTLRLLYVTCTRAVNSLALVLYTTNIEIAKCTCISNGWFADDEITVMH